MSVTFYSENSVNRNFEEGVEGAVLVAVANLNAEFVFELLGFVAVENTETGEYLTPFEGTVSLEEFEGRVLLATALYVGVEQTVPQVAFGHLLSYTRPADYGQDVLAHLRGAIKYFKAQGDKFIVWY
jgi:hypothetical protein